MTCSTERSHLTKVLIFALCVNEELGAQKITWKTQGSLKLIKTNLEICTDDTTIDQHTHALV